MSISLSNITSDPFALSSLIFGYIAWVISIAGAGASSQSGFPHFCWWGIFFQLMILFLVTALYLINSIEFYKFALVGLLSVAFVYNTNTVNHLIYKSYSSANLCCAAGGILLSMLNLIWIVYFGGHPESPSNQLIDSFAYRRNSQEHTHLNIRDSKFMEDNLDEKRFDSAASQGNFQDNNLRQSQLTNNIKSTSGPYMSSSQLNGLDDFSNPDFPKSRDLTNSNPNRISVYIDTQSQQREPTHSFRYKAKALYSYSANPEDVNEISFEKNEILEVDDIDGKWWQAKRSNGEMGICPSNYVKLLD